MFYVRAFRAGVWFLPYPHPSHPILKSVLRMVAVVAVAR